MRNNIKMRYYILCTGATDTPGKCDEMYEANGVDSLKIEFTEI